VALVDGNVKNLGDATSAHFLDQPGLPEVPGGTQH
jgi:hypothetical protein